MRSVPPALFLVLLLLALGTARPAAQAPTARQPEFFAIMSPPTPAEALENPLSAKLAERLGKVWYNTADVGCRTSKSLDLAHYTRLARGRLIAVGEHIKQMSDSAVDVARADAQFISLAGPDAFAEMRRLASDPAVIQFLALLRRGNAVGQTQLYLENIERALLLNRIPTHGQASPIATGDDPALLTEIETVGEAAANFAGTNNSAAIHRFLELMTMAQSALSEASNREELMKWGPGRLMSQLEGPLRDNCVIKK